MLRSSTSSSTSSSSASIRAAGPPNVDHAAPARIPRIEATVMRATTGNPAPSQSSAVPLPAATRAICAGSTGGYAAIAIPASSSAPAPAPTQPTAPPSPTGPSSSISSPPLRAKRLFRFASR